MVAASGKFAENKLFFLSTFAIWHLHIAYRPYISCGGVCSTAVLIRLVLIMLQLALMIDTAAFNFSGLLCSLKVTGQVHCVFGEVLLLVEEDSLPN